MARLKQTPVKSSPPQKTDQKSTRKRRKATKRGATDLASAASVGKRQRSQSKTESKVSKTQRKSRAKGKRCFPRDQFISVWKRGLKT